MDLLFMSDPKIKVYQIDSINISDYIKIVNTNKKKGIEPYSHLFNDVEQHCDYHIVLIRYSSKERKQISIFIENKCSSVSMYGFPNGNC